MLMSQGCQFWGPQDAGHVWLSHVHHPPDGSETFFTLLELHALGTRFP